MSKARIFQATGEGADAENPGAEEWSGRIRQRVGRKKCYSRVEQTEMVAKASKINLWGDLHATWLLDRVSKIDCHDFVINHNWHHDFNATGSNFSVGRLSATEELHSTGLSALRQLNCNLLFAYRHQFAELTSHHHWVGQVNEMHRQ